MIINTFISICALSNTSRNYKLKYNKMKDLLPKCFISSLTVSSVERAQDEIKHCGKTSVIYLIKQHSTTSQTSKIKLRLKIFYNKEVIN